MTQVYHHRENAAVAGLPAQAQRRSVATGVDPRRPDSRLQMTLRRFIRLGISLIAVLFLMASSAVTAAQEKRPEAAESDRVAGIIDTLIQIVRHGELRDTKYMERLLHVSFVIKGGWVNYEDKQYMSAIDLVPNSQPFRDYLELSSYTIYNAGTQLPSVQSYVASVTFMASTETICIPKHALNSRLVKLFGVPNVRLYSYFFSGSERQSRFHVVVSGSDDDENCLYMVEIEQIIER